MIVYKITNRVNGKVYIGKCMGSSRAEDRWSNHKSDAKNGSPYYFHRAIRKYGPKAFKVEILYTAKTPHELSQMETFFIILHQSHFRENGYNLTLGGDGGSLGELNYWFGTHGPMGGKHHKKESKQRTSQALKGIPKTPEHVKNAAEGRKRVWASTPIEQRLAIGRKMTDARKGLPHPNKGKFALASSQVSEIKAMRDSFGFSYSQLGKQFNVATMTAWHAVNTRELAHAY